MNHKELYQTIIDLIKRYYGLPEDTYLEEANIYLTTYGLEIRNIKLERAESKEE